MNEMSDKVRHDTTNARNYFETLVMIIIMMSPTRFSEEVWDEL